MHTFSESHACVWEIAAMRFQKSIHAFFEKTQQINAQANTIHPVNTLNKGGKIQ
ncbi:hypothetical protein M2459_002241 [Parabacteroides sp. PF5-5]|nr:hypothetical protein [Parabacteroides sp. PH5-39]MDH6316494.1 hypothetical protein [Parabacteroides sp. PF5-13]MDH6320004.1 hypothetical protein [Parabacteroides sp. PH5-13]MDH6323763.1 hypothetical protein [Parabacteroides sp. PH5-8]MDH6327681.1 hypothetical protein [Parabacteroides sp. PH5-41]MDH6335482.1 hypothetical protein [Parabacteroides sp. PF5-5]MDH6346574.1 hypothetical protein [Parabacteroides sp. PH5-46]MDH6361536.1 hypothetical protein [Parabacteroides sp. PH5-16]MDH6377203.